MLSHSVIVQFFKTLWTVARQAPLSMGFYRQEYWSRFLFPSPGDLCDPGIKARSPALQVDYLPFKPPWNPKEGIQRAKTQVKICLTSLIIREIQINYNETSPHTFRNGHHIKSTSNKCWLEYGEKGSLLHSAWECKLILSVWKRVWRFLKKTKNRSTIWFCNPTPGHISGGKHGSKGYKHHQCSQ